MGGEPRLAQLLHFGLELGGTRARFRQTDHLCYEPRVLRHHGGYLPMFGRLPSVRG